MKTSFLAALIVTAYPAIALAQGGAGAGSMNEVQGSGDTGTGTLGSPRESSRTPSGVEPGAQVRDRNATGDRDGPGVANPTAPRQQP